MNVESSAILLLADPSPCLRYRVLTEILGLPEHDSEVREVKSARKTDALFRSVGGYAGPTTLRSVVTDLRRLGFLGFDRAKREVKERVEYLFSLQNNDGSWPLASSSAGDESERTGYSMVPLQTALPLIALSACGYSRDARAEAGYRWLMSQRLDDGAWPTGKASGVNGRVAGYRKLPHSRWGCRSNTTGALIALAGHEKLRKGQECLRAADLLLSREKYEAANLGYSVARGVGAELVRGFITYFARSDPGLMLELGFLAGFSFDEPRMSELRRFILGERRNSGLWHYGRKPQVSRWVSFFLLKTLLRDGSAGSTRSEEPPTPFTEYPRVERRW